MTGGMIGNGASALLRRGVGVGAASSSSADNNNNGNGNGNGNGNSGGPPSPPRYDRTEFGTLNKRGGGGVHHRHRPQSPPEVDVDGAAEDEGHKGHGGTSDSDWPSAARRLILSVVHHLRRGQVPHSLLTSARNRYRRDPRQFSAAIFVFCCCAVLLLLRTLRGGGGSGRGIDGGIESPPPPRRTPPRAYLPRRPALVLARPPPEHMPPPVDAKRPHLYEPDYGGIEGYAPPSDGAAGRRTVVHRYVEGESHVRGPPRERYPPPVYFDDDVSNRAAGIDTGANGRPALGYIGKRDRKERERKKRGGGGGECRDTANRIRFHPTCNEVHGYSILGDGGEYRGKGAFREVIGFFSDDDERRPDDLNGTATPISNFDRPVPFVMKIERSLRKRRDPDEIRQQIRVDAMVMETLTSSPAICDIYSHCGTTVVTERLYEEAEDIVIPGEWYMKHSDLKDSKDVDPQNEPPLTATDKLRIAHEMAQGIASLHGNPGGIIVHDDHRLCQYLRDKTGRIKLNDFNRAEVMKWNEEEGEYCRYPNHGAWGNHRSPEEYRGKLLSEKIDVYSMGNNIYSLLTGLDVYYENEDDGVAQSFIKKGELPFIDDRYRTRSYAEGALVKILLRCWVYDPSERADIFEVSNFLREAVETNARLAAEGKTTLK